MDKTQLKPDVQEKKPKRPWPLWKKLAIAGALLLVVIALAVGLGVGLTRGGGGGGDDNDDDGGDDQGGDDGGDDGDVPGSGPNRTTAWKPEVGASWQIILLRAMDLSSGGDITPDVEVYDLDLYDNDVETFKTLQDAGKKVICYFSAGSWENWRDDKDDFDKADLGKTLDGWEDERWLDVTSDNVRNIMKQRIKLAWTKGCDAIDPDNVDGFQNDNGLGLTSEDAVDYMKFLSKEAKSYKMAIGLKNSGSIVPDVLDAVDFAVNEQCVQYAECDVFSPFTDDDKPVFHIEYPDSAPKVAAKTVDGICSGKDDAAGAGDFSTVIKNLNLDGWVEYCDGKTYTTDLD